MARILVVDDEKVIVKGLKFSLEQEGYEVDCAYDGEEAVALAKKNDYDAMLLDVMLPKYTGYEVCNMVREFSQVPILMLTAKNDDMDKIMGFEYGADDYITKPFNILEVKARVRAIIRRAKSTEKQESKSKVEPVENMEGIVVDSESRRVMIDGVEINLTAREFDILELMVNNPNKVYSRESLLQIVWGYD